jgi:hypothetical protein
MTGSTFGFFIWKKIYQSKSVWYNKKIQILATDLLIEDYLNQENYRQGSGSHL